MKTIEFIGGGRIAKIFLRAFKNVKVSFNQVTVYDVNFQALTEISNIFPYVKISESSEEIVKSDIIILAVHPPVIMDVLSEIKGKIKPESVVLSLSPKFSIQKISDVLGGHANIARMNPSASTIVNRGVNPIAFSPSFNSTKKMELLDLLSPLGFTPEIADSKIEAYAVIGAMGHTYFNFQLQKLKELAISFGMDESEAETTISNMLWGTAETLFKSGLSYDEVVNLVPVKPLGEVEDTIKDFYDKYLNGIYNKIKT